MSDEMVGLEEAATHLGVHRSTLMQMAKTGKIEAQGTGPSMRFSRAAIQKAKDSVAKEEK